MSSFYLVCMSNDHQTLHILEPYNRTHDKYTLFDVYLSLCEQKFAWSFHEWLSFLLSDKTNQ